mgnify:FL=1
MYNDGLFAELKLYGAEIDIQIIIDTGFHFIRERKLIIIIISFVLFSTAISGQSFSVRPGIGYEVLRSFPTGRSLQ